MSGLFERRISMSQDLNMSKADSAGPEQESTFPQYEGPAFFSYGFRPFFLSAGLFAGIAVPSWVVIFAAAGGAGFLYPPRDWHVHEMLFGFLSAVITGFLLTAVPNWTGRPPLRGLPLLGLWMLWLAGRLLVALPWPSPLAAAVVDSAFLVAVALILWREIRASTSWRHAPIGLLITVYAASNIAFHVTAFLGSSTDLTERSALGLIMLLLTVIGGRVVPNFTREYLIQSKITTLPPPLSAFDGFSIGLVIMAAAAWIVQPHHLATAALWMAAGGMNLVRLRRWRGWLAWREPLIAILHVGYAWLVLAFLALGGATLRIGFSQANAVHVLTTGAVGAMTLGIMTRASLGHTGRQKRAGAGTVVIYILVNLGALLRILVAAETPTTMTDLILGLSAACWSGAYVLFVLIYGPLLLRPSLDE
jgi:uncharacterized protein involved in response to NO